MMKRLSLVLFFLMAVFSCKDTKKEQETLDKELEQIQAVEQSIDTTITTVHKKAEEVEALLKELDSI